MKTAKTLLFSLIFTFAVNVGADPICEQHATVTTAVSPATIPGFNLPATYAEMKPMQSHCNPGAELGIFKYCRSGNLVYIEYYDGRKLAAQVSAIIDERGTTIIYFDKIQVHPDYRGRGLSTQLFEAALQLGGPKVERVSAQLAHTNYQAVMEEYYALTTPGHPRYNPVLSKTEANALAIKASPFAKSLSHFGFTEISRAQIEWVTINGPPYASMIDVIIRKPQ